MDAYNFRKEQFGNYLPGMAPHQDDLDAMGYEHVYRGLSRSHLTDLRLDQHLGNHWSYDPQVANHFATSGGISLYESVHPDTLSSGYVVSARVHPQHIADLDNRKDDFEAYGGRAIYGPDSNEQEATVRDDAPVRITGLEKVRNVTPKEHNDGIWDEEFEKKPVTTFKPRIGRA